jgi:hypothetical protein
MAKFRVLINLKMTDKAKGERVVLLRPFLTLLPLKSRDNAFAVDPGLFI